MFNTLDKDISKEQLDNHNNNNSSNGNYNSYQNADYSKLYRNTFLLPAISLLPPSFRSPCASDL